MSVLLGCRADGFRFGARRFWSLRGGGTCGEGLEGGMGAQPRQSSMGGGLMGTIVPVPGFLGFPPTCMCTSGRPGASMLPGSASQHWRNPIGWALVGFPTVGAVRGHLSIP